MSVLAKLSPTYRQTFGGTTVEETNKSSEHGDHPVSPYGTMVDTLQLLKRSDPPLYWRVTQEVAARLRIAAWTADAGLDIRELATRRRGTLLRCIASRLNLLFPQDSDWREDSASRSTANLQEDL
jgi:hypothetical protein